MEEFVRWWVLGTMFTVGLCQGEDLRNGDKPDALVTVLICLIFWPLLASLVVGRAITRGPK